jgi:circadian clock protein KaiC
VTGLPGTSKTTLAGKFAEAACLRGERTLFVSYDEAADQIVRNLASVGIQLRPHVKSGLLRIYSAHTEAIGAEEHLIKLRSLIREHEPLCMVIDPLTALGKSSTVGAARMVANRVIHMVKDFGITLFLTALTETEDPQAESTDLQISTIADTWIHLSYLVTGGERNRALTIVKSRGTAHSNQVRELVLSASGPTLTDVYSAGGDVLMGTQRWEKEAEESATKVRHQSEYEHKRRELQLAEANTDAQIKALQMHMERQRADLARLSGQQQTRGVSSDARDTEMARRRRADPSRPAPVKRTNGSRP